MQQIEKSVNDERVVMSVLDKAEPSKMSSIESEGYLKISGTFKSVYSNNITILPYLLAGSTDSKHFAELTDNIYRVSPFTIALKEASGIHGVNERVSIESFIKGVNFYRSLFLNAALVPKPST